MNGCHRIIHGYRIPGPSLFCKIASGILVTRPGSRLTGKVAGGNTVGAFLPVRFCEFKFPQDSSKIWVAHQIRVL